MYGRVSQYIIVSMCLMLHNNKFLPDGKVYTKRCEI